MFCMISIFIIKIISSWSNSKLPLFYASFLGIPAILSMVPIHHIFSHTSSLMAIDHISFPIVLMVVVLTLALEMANLFSHHSNMLITLSLLTFLVTKMILFYVLFELNLIPIFLVILGWGYQPERLFASKMMLFYTLAGSLPLLLMIILHPGLIYINSTFIPHSSHLPSLMMILITLAFLVKLPVFALHLWLPLAHVEAPIMGSMILAAILLKLGGYGLMRMNTLMANHTNFYSPALMIICTTGASLALLFCVTQVDLKVIIAYSSVGHMSLAAASVYSLSSSGYSSALINFVTHGFASSLMFFVASLMYNISKTRHILLNKGTLTLAPSMVGIWFITCLLNAGGPPSMNLLAEILAVITSINFSSMLILPIFVYLLLGMLFNMKVFSLTSQGNPQESSISLFTMTFSESLTSMFHLLASFTALLTMFCMLI